jgi:hypothetical protein
VRLLVKDMEQKKREVFVPLTQEPSGRSCQRWSSKSSLGRTGGSKLWSKNWIAMPGRLVEAGKGTLKSTQKRRDTPLNTPD